MGIDGKLEKIIKQISHTNQILKGKTKKEIKLKNIYLR
jgi:hypothetical protein